MLGTIYDVILSIYVLGRDKVKRADLVILAPAPPVRRLLMGFGNGLAAYFDLHGFPYVAVLEGES